MKYSGIGGQAVIEGIMMQNGNDYAIAVRKPDGDIEVKKDTYVSITRKHKFLGLPFIRGIFSFIDSMVVGMRALTWSCSFFEDDEEAKPSRFEAWLDKVFGEKLEGILMSVVMVFSFVMAIGIFMVLPLLIARFCKSFIHSETVMAILEGVIRIIIFIAYIKLVSRMEDIKRTFMYHGSEHKCINCIEHGLELTVDNVRASSKEHKRCGTSFIMIVMIISILFFMVIRVDTIWLRIVSRIVLIPVIAGVSYEFLRFAGRHDSKLVNILSRPGMWMQGLTTTEPDDSMIEVAIAAVETVFDWRNYLDETFPGWKENSAGIQGGGTGSACDEKKHKGAAGHDHAAAAMAGNGETE
ncbi:DUF1385 domain-containing protein [Lachnoclostridium pacaense]|uniref:DUF1385 domain-containing protein n=1 Tax=Enterocloster hominis (ex Hitch et al. 2024) TaxID=1917870 RepID=UPI001D1266CB|nr:DUF1385 domain-containing protein [Lachnoclostridium pacaense]MCC2817526.1 DUF1385 domain-containing protein [Lachnoclostridium pacaense]